MVRNLINSGSIFEKEVGYSRAVVAGDFVFVSGCTGFDYQKGTIEPGARAQCEQTILNIENALEMAGSSLEDVVRVVFYFAEPKVFSECKPVFKRHFGVIRPTLTAVGAQLHDERILLEIEVTAIKKA